MSKFQARLASKLFSGRTFLAMSLAAWASTLEGQTIPDASPETPTATSSALMPSPPVLSPSISTEASPNRTVTLKVQRDGKTFYGMPLATDGNQIALVRWDGRLIFIPAGARDVKVTKYQDGFRPYSAQELRTRLKKYFGNRYDISTTEHFVVIHPRGSEQLWARPFENHYVGINRYFNDNGFETHEPEFPLVAIVLRSRREFDLRLDREGIFDKSILGYYAKDSNRITTFAPPNMRLTAEGNRQTENWLQSSVTIVHEVAHQIAFNCGLHNRFSSVPKWTSEGLAMLCETPGVYASRAGLNARVNRLRLTSWRKLDEAGKTSGRLLDLIESDRLFDTDPELAYAISWAISFYLNEERQLDYFAYLKADNRRGDFREFTNVDRAGFFIRHFGNDIEGLERRMQLFLESIP